MYGNNEVSCKTNHDLSGLIP